MAPSKTKLVLKPKKKTGFVYFARGKNTGLTKIGFSRKLEQRRKGLQSNSGEPVEILFSMRGDLFLESQFHSFFNNFAQFNEARGTEWYDFQNGGLRGMQAQANGFALALEGIERRLCEHPKLSWDECAGILGENWSASTLRRKYG